MQVSSVDYSLSDNDTQLNESLQPCVSSLNWPRFPLSYPSSLRRDQPGFRLLQYTDSYQQHCCVNSFMPISGYVVLKLVRWITFKTHRNNVA
jgi:hypothetical protein